MKNKRLGALTYNLIHNYLLAITLVAIGVLIENTLLISLGLILSAHLGIDRLIGYGLKYPTHFKDTHLQKL